MVNEELHTGTTTVGIVCQEGVVLAADTRATAGNMIVDKKAKKIHQINENLALTIAGTVSDVQLLIRLLKAELSLLKHKTYRLPTVKESSNLLSNMVYANIRKMSMIPGISHFIIGGKDSSGFHLYDLFPDGSLTECENFISSGSGSVFAYGVLETLHTDSINLNDAAKLAVKAVNAALQRDSASGNGIDLLIVSKDGIKFSPPKRLNTVIEA